MLPHSKPYLSHLEQDALRKRLSSGMLASGSRNRDFESAFIERFGYLSGRSTASGCGALGAALRLLDLRPGDGVILPSYICPEVINTLRINGLIPVFADLGSGWALDPSDVEKRLHPNVKAILGVHTFGLNCPIEQLRGFGLPVIEDSCQSLGMAEGRERCDSGDLTIFSFHAIKCLCAGEGGILCTRHPHMAPKLEKLSGWRAIAGSMSDLSAELALTQFEQYPTMLERRIKIAKEYHGRIRPSLVERFLSHASDRPTYRFLLEIPEGSYVSLCQAYAEAGIAVRRGVDFLGHRDANLPDETFPNTTQRFRSTLSLPFYPALSDEEFEDVIRVTHSVLGAEDAGSPTTPRRTNP